MEKPRPGLSTVARAVFKSRAMRSTPMVCNRKLIWNESQSLSPIEPSTSMKDLEKSNDFFNKSQNNSSLQNVVCKGKSKNVSPITLSSISDDNKERENKRKRLENIITLLKNNADKSNKMVQTSNKSLNAVKKVARSSTTTHVIKERPTGELVAEKVDGQSSSSSDTSDASDFLYQCEKSNILPHNIFKAAALYSKKKLSIDSAAPRRPPSGLCKSKPLVKADPPETLNVSSSLDKSFFYKTVPKKKVFVRKIKNNSISDKPFQETQITRTTSKKDMATSTSEKLDTPNIVVQEQNSKSTSVRDEPVNLSPEIENVQITFPDRVNNRLEREKVVTRLSSKNKDLVEGRSSATHEIGPVQSTDISFDLNQNKRKRTVSQIESDVDKKRCPAIPSKTKRKKNLADNRNQPVLDAAPDRSPTKKKEKELRVVIESIDDSILIPILSSRTQELTFGPFKNLHLVNDVGMIITYNDSIRGFSRGYMKIAPGGRSSKQISNIHNMFFTIHEGEAKVGIQNIIHIYKKHSFFNVMKGCEYFIKNMKRKENLLLSFLRVDVG